MWIQVTVKGLKSKSLSCNFLPSEKQEVALANISDGGLSTIIQFTYHSNSQMFSILKKTASKCSHISQTYSIGRSVEGKDLLVIEFSNNPGQHELCKCEVHQCSEIIQLFRKDAIKWSRLIANTFIRLKICFQYIDI